MFMFIQYQMAKFILGKQKIYKQGGIMEKVILKNDRETALRLESVLIALLKTENPDYGYNQTDIYEKALKLYAARIPDDNVSLEKAFNEEGFLMVQGCPVLLVKN